MDVTDTMAAVVDAEEIVALVHQRAQDAVARIPALELVVRQALAPVVAAAVALIRRCFL